MNATNDSAGPRGCSFLLTPAGSEHIFTPEQFTDDQRLFASTAQEFMDREVLPDVDRLEKQEDGIMVAKLKQAGELGLLMIDVPEAYGGLELDKTTSMLVSEKLATYASFSVSHGGHIGIGMLPLVFFGNDEQKERYLPRLATGELLAAYALTEPGSGSDALGAKTSATPATQDGVDGYVLQGTKMWITNAGFADLFTVFAKVDGEKFTAFLVEATYDGVTTGAEEHKMGLKGSSTRALNLDGVFVPATNVLGEIGRGHKIAFNILNFGRFKLGVGTVGGAKRTLRIAIEYALERKQFKAPIASFGAIKQKVADMALRIYALESMSYRVAGYMDTTIDELDKGSDTYASDIMAAIEEFAVEDSIMKVHGSETIDFVADEAVQIHGGYGYSAEYEVERTYRDSRINRIFEGTNEINRMLIPGMILKRTMKGELPLFEVIQLAEAVVKGERAEAPAPADDALDYERFVSERGKLLTVYLANLAIQRHMADFKDQQELMLALADLMMHVYVVDSTLSRVQQRIDEGTATPVHLAIAKVISAETHSEMLTIAERLMPSLSDSGKLDRRFDALSKFSYRPRVDFVALKRQLADYMLENPRWSL